MPRPTIESGHKLTLHGVALSVADHLPRGADVTFDDASGGSVMGDGALTRKTETAASFNSRAADFDRQGLFAHFGRRLVEVVGVEPGQRVLDVATGRGAVLFPAIERVGTTGEAVGVDLAEGMVQAANEEAERRGWGPRVRTMDAERLDFPDAAFDRVFCGFGVMSFPHVDQALSEFRRVLKPGGRLGVSTWRVGPFEEIQSVLDELCLGSQRSGWISEPEDLTRLLLRTGFTDVRVAPDPTTHSYADVEEFWRGACCAGPRRLDSLDAAQLERTRTTLRDRLRAGEGPGGLDLVAIALLGVATR
jgi:ubiquinone/menaquinone biosynthesis C-methylase UbiE